MAGTRVVVVCPVCEVHWDRDGQAPGCADASHFHRDLEVHRHLYGGGLAGWHHRDGRVV